MASIVPRPVRSRVLGNAFGSALRRWREGRGYSQEHLASLAEVSARHLSFLENGRAAPSREMVLVLGSALDLPLRDRNALLVSAGYAAAYRESPLNTPEFRAVWKAIERMLTHHDPFPAVVFDRYWNIVGTNNGAMSFYGWLLDGVALPTNALRALFAPGVFRSSLVNWEEVATLLLERTRRELEAAPDDREGHALWEEILSYPGVRPLLRPSERPLGALPFVPVVVRKNDEEFRFFTTLTSLGTPLDVTAQELHIESYFPADDETDQRVRSLVNKET